MDTVNYVTIFPPDHFPVFACVAVSLICKLGTLVVCRTFTGIAGPLVCSPAARVCLCTGRCNMPCWIVGPTSFTSTGGCGEGQ